MYKSGHLGISNLLYAPIAAILVLTNPITDIPHIPFALLGLLVIGYTASLPDIDMRLKNEKTVSERGALGYAEFIATMIAIVALPTVAFFYLSPPVFEILGMVGGYTYLASAVALIVLALFTTAWRHTKSIKHRGITHTVWFALFIGVVSAFLAVFGVLSVAFLSGTNVSTAAVDSLFSLPSILAFGVYCGFLGTIGVLFHFVGDMITPTPIQPFYPYSNTRYGREFEIFGKRSLAASPFWNGMFSVLGTIAMLSVVLIHPDVRPIIIDVVQLFIDQIIG